MVRFTLISFLVIHTIVTVLALKDGSVWAVFPPFREAFVYQIFSDLVVSLGIVFLLCFLRLKEKQRSPKKLFIAMVGAAMFGSFSPLVYLLIERDLFE